MASRRSLQQRLNQHRPIAWEHPLNRGLVFEPCISAPLPGCTGSDTVYDMVRGAKPAHDGSLVAGVKFIAGMLIFDGATGYVTAPPPTRAIGAIDGAELSVSIYVSYSNAAANQLLMQQSPTNTQWLLFTDGGSLYWRGNNTGGGTSEVSTAAPTGNAYHHICATLKNYINGVQYSDSRIYVDGIEVANGGPTDLVNGTCIQKFAWGTANIDIGALVDLSAFYLAGNVRYAEIWDRVLSPGEVLYLYDQLLCRNPDRYNWLPRGGYGVAAAVPAGAFNPYYYRHLAGGRSNF